MVDSDNEQIFKLAGMIYYVDPKAVGTMDFLGNKERIQIPIIEAHWNSGLKAECEKRCLGSSIETELCRLEKSTSEVKQSLFNKQRW